MCSLIIKPETLFDAWKLYTEYLHDSRQKNVISLAQTALFRYTLPGHGLEYTSDKKTVLEFMKGIPLSLFVDALNVQQNVFDHLSLTQTNFTKANQRSQRHRLRQMLDWCSAQNW